MKINNILYILLFLAGSAQAVSTNIYKWVDENNQVHFSGQRPLQNDGDMGGNQGNIEVIQQGVQNPKANDDNESSGGDFAEIQSDGATLTDSDLQAAQQAGEQKLQVYCSTQKKRLAVMLANPLIAIDDEGKEKLLSAAQREERIDQLQLELKDRCTAEQ